IQPRRDGLSPPRAAEPRAELTLRPGVFPQLISLVSNQPLAQDGDTLVSPAREWYPVRDGIPRFVDELDYVESFGEQWKRYRRVQLDSETGKSLSRTRLLDGTGWSPEELRDELVLEVGCGAGRFTEVLLD